VSPFLIAKIIVAADVRRLKFPCEQSFISGLLTSAAASLTGCEGRYYTSFSPTDERFQSRRAGCHFPQKNPLTLFIRWQASSPALGLWLRF
jgi:hypothetical protein